MDKKEIVRKASGVGDAQDQEKFFTENFKFIASLFPQPGIKGETSRE